MDIALGKPVRIQLLCAGGIAEADKHVPDRIGQGDLCRGVLTRICFRGTAGVVRFYILRFFDRLFLSKVCLIFMVQGYVFWPLAAITFTVPVFLAVKVTFFPDTAESDPLLAFERDQAAFLVRVKVNLSPLQSVSEVGKAAFFLTVTVHLSVRLPIFAEITDFPVRFARRTTRL